MRIIIFLFIFFISTLQTNAQTAVQENLMDSFHSNDFSITYSISIESRKKKSIAETYNGAVKTVFVKHNAVKLRLVSLMRIQDIFYNYQAKDSNAVAFIVKESGRDKYRTRLTSTDWEQINSKYDAAEMSFPDDSLVILGKVCLKAILKLKDGNTLTTYYLPAIKNEALEAGEPMFAGIPGIVLQYEYHDGSRKILYKATSLNFEDLPKNIFTIPSKGYATKRFAPGKTSKVLIADEPEEP